MPLCRELHPVRKPPSAIQDLCATDDELVVVGSLAKQSRFVACSRLDKASRPVCEISGFVSRMFPAGNCIAAFVIPDWPFRSDGTPLGMHFEDRDPPEIFDQKRDAFAKLGKSTRLVVVDPANGTTRELARSTADFELGDVVFTRDGATLALAGCRQDDSGSWQWSTRVVDVATGAIRAQYAVDEEAICPHSWDSRGLVLYSRIFRHPAPKTLYRVARGDTTALPLQPDGITSPDGACTVRLEDGVLHVARGGEVRSIVAEQGLAKALLNKLGTLPSGRIVEDGAWWWGRRLVLGQEDPFVLDVDTLELVRLLPRAADAPIIGDRRGSWIAGRFDGKLMWAQPTTA